jgi:hypothetical protein
MRNISSCNRVTKCYNYIVRLIQPNKFTGGLKMRLFYEESKNVIHCAINFSCVASVRKAFEKKNIFNLKEITIKPIDIDFIKNYDDIKNDLFIYKKYRKILKNAKYFNYDFSVS